MHMKRLVFAKFYASITYSERKYSRNASQLIQNGIEGQISYCKYIYNSISIEKILKELKCNHITQNECAIVIYFGLSHCSSHISCAFIAELKTLSFKLHLIF